MRVVCHSSFVLIAVLCILSSSPGFSQIQQASLAASLKGTEAVSKITIGDKGVPSSIPGQYAVLPVDTLVYPEGQIVYQLEGGFIPVVVEYLQTSFATGTTFQISGVGFKDDRLELKLTSRDSGSRHLKIMLGAGWQKRMTDQDVILAVSKFLSVPSAQPNTMEADNMAAAARSQSTPVTPGISTAASSYPYTRSPQLTILPGRIAESELRIIFDIFDSEKRSARQELFAKARPLANTLSTIWYNEHKGANIPDHPRMADIDAMERRLGKTFLPGTPDDLLQMIEIIRHGAGLFWMFSPPDWSNLDDSIREAIKEEVALQSALDDSRACVVSIEEDLDRGDYGKAENDFDSLSPAPLLSHSAPVDKYLAITQDLRADLVLRSRLGKSRNESKPDLLTRIRSLEEEEVAFKNSVKVPITASFARGWITEDKESLRADLISLPAFQTEVKPFVLKHDHASSTFKQFTEQLDSASKDWEQLKRDLESAHDLVEITSDQVAMQSIRSWYGSESAESLMTKATGVASAKENEVMLMVYVGLATGDRNREQAAIQLHHQQEEARKQALIDERNNLAGAIWNKVIMITMLDEKFRLTEVMGYTIEADKQRAQLNNLIRQDHAMLTPSLWAEVDKAYQQMLPGLTVWQASHARTIIEGLRSSAR